MRSGRFRPRPHPRGRGHTVAVIDKQAKAFRRLPEGFSGRTIAGRRLRPRPAARGRHRGGGALAAVTSGDNSNIMVARTARGVRARAGDRPHLRPPAGRDLREARHPDHRHRAVDDRSGPATDPTRHAAHRVDGPVAGRRAGGAPVAPSWAGGGSPTSRWTAWRIAALSRLGVGQVPEPDLVTQEGDVLYVTVAADRLAGSTSTSSGGTRTEPRATGEGRHRRWRATSGPSSPLSSPTGVTR